MKSVYLIYVSIPEKVFNNVKYLIGETAKEYKWKNNCMYGLYAWTDKGKYLDEFVGVRYTQIYTIIKKEMEYDDFKRLKKLYKDTKLSLYNFNISDSNQIQVVCTSNEYNVSVNEYDMFIDEFALPISEEADFSIFNKKVLDALDKLGYIDNYIRKYMYEDESLISEIDNNQSYGLTYRGNKHLVNFSNELGKFVVLFRFFLMGVSRYENSLFLFG